MQKYFAYERCGNDRNSWEAVFIYQKKRDFKASKQCTQIIEQL